MCVCVSIKYAQSNLKTEALCCICKKQQQQHSSHDYIVFSQLPVKHVHQFDLAPRL